MFINIANVFVTSGFSTALVQNKEANRIDFSTNFYCSLAVSVLVYLILFIAAPFIEKFYDMQGLALVLRVFALRIPLSAYSAIQHAYVERHMIFKRYFFSTLGGTLISGVDGIIMHIRALERGLLLHSTLLIQSSIFLYCQLLFHGIQNLLFRGNRLKV